MGNAPLAMAEGEKKGIKMIANTFYFHVTDYYNDVVLNPELIKTEVLPIIGGAIVIGGGLILVGWGIFIIASNIQSWRMHRAEKPVVPGGEQ